MERLKLVFVIGILVLFASMSMLGFLFAMYDIFGKSFNWKAGVFSISLVWAAIGFYTLVEKLIEKRNNPRNQ